MADYIDREAAYDDFEKCNSENPKWTPSRVKALIARQKAVNAVPVQWIPVTERLPDNDDFVLVVASGQAGNIRLDNAFELGQFSMSEGWILEMWPEWEDPKVTHWMPLPEPPEAEAALEGGN